MGESERLFEIKSTTLHIKGIKLQFTYKVPYDTKSSIRVSMHMILFFKFDIATRSVNRRNKFSVIFLPNGSWMVMAICRLF